MADTKVTALTANTAPISTDIIPMVDDPAGVALSQKVSLADLMALFANPVSDAGDSLGTTALKWADLFLASGGVINFNNGNVTITHSAAALVIAGGRLELAAGTTAIAPLKFTPGTNLTTPQDGALEMDADCLYGCTDAGNRGYIPIKHVIRADATRTFTSNTSEQAIFTSPANGRLTLEAGCYLFEGLLRIDSMSATSGNAAIDILGAGTATIAAWLWHAVGVDGATATAATQTGSTTVTQQSAASISTAGTGTGLTVRIRGTFEVTSPGTIIPSLTMVTAAASVVAIGSYITFERIGSTSVVSVGQWD